jgi:two-component system response regulator MprA
VLLVDDDADLCELVTIALEEAGYEVATVTNGRDALYYLHSRSTACLILLDLMLPRMDGAAFRTAQLRDRSLAWIPVVVLSGAVGGDQKARELQAAAFVRKPIDIDTLRDTVVRISATVPGRPRLRRADDEH